MAETDIRTMAIFGWAFSPLCGLWWRFWIELLMQPKAIYIRLAEMMQI